MAKADYRPEIDGLRTVAVMAVIAFHLGAPWLPGGFVGVDVFFVISGYLITKITWGQLDSGSFSVLQFFLGRARRLLPALYVVIAATLAVAAFLLIPPHFIWLGKSATAAMAFVSNVQFWGEAGYFDINGHFKPLLHTWSLSVEMQFYLGWPFLLLIAHRLGGRTTGFALIAVVSAASLVANILSLSETNDIFYLTHFRVYEFGIGALVALVQWPPFKAQTSAAASAVGLLAIAASFLIFNSRVAHPGFAALLPCVGAALVIVGSGKGRVGALLTTPLMTYLGRISYSLYLVHWPVIVIYFYWRFDEVSLPEIVALLVVIFALSDALNRFVEVPLRRPWRVGMRRVPGKSIAAIAILASLLAISNSVAMSDGWEWRTTRAVGHEFEEALDSPACEEGFGLCEQGATDALLFGDSHSNMLKSWAAGDSLKRKRRLAQVAAIPGCLAVWNNDDECEAQMDLALDGIEKSDSSALYLFSNWNPYTHRFPAEFVLERLQETLQRLRRAGISVQVNGSLPFMERDPTICTSRPFNSGCPSVMTPIDYPAQQAFNASLKTVVESAGAEYVDFFADLCNADGCRVTFDGLSLYGDRYHFSGKAISAYMLMRHSR